MDQEAPAIPRLYESLIALHKVLSPLLSQTQDRVASFSFLLPLPEAVSASLLSVPSWFIHSTNVLYLAQGTVESPGNTVVIKVWCLPLGSPRSGQGDRHYTNRRYKKIQLPTVKRRCTLGEGCREMAPPRESILKRTFEPGSIPTPTHPHDSVKGVWPSTSSERKVTLCSEPQLSIGGKAQLIWRSESDPGVLVLEADSLLKSCRVYTPSPARPH